MNRGERYVIIMAGGKGERFWPLSREVRPKQLLNLLGKSSLLQQAVQRVRTLVPLENILVITNKVQLASVQSQLPDLPGSNLLAEPVGRDTCAAVALGAAWVGARNPRAVMAVIPADHLIQDRKGFQSTLRDCFDHARQSGSLLTIGIRPTFPATGYGYLQVGAAIPSEGAVDGFFRVQRFVEKPDLPKARRFLKAGNFRWNAGMFVWSYAAIKDALESYHPELAQASALWKESALDPVRLSRCLTRSYAALSKISVDVAIMEKASNVQGMDARFDWDDLGSWTSLEAYLKSDAEGNGIRGDLVHVDARHNLVFDGRSAGRTTPIALIGIEHAIVVLTDDAVMVAAKSHAQQIRKLVVKLRQQVRYRSIV